MTKRLHLKDETWSSHTSWGVNLFRIRDQGRVGVEVSMKDEDDL